MTGDARRVPALDGLRGVAIAAVLFHHAVTWSAGPRWLGGHHGVTVFFVLSGFLITSLLLEERDRTDRVSLHRFWRRRVARLGPALWVAVPIMLVLQVWVGVASGPEAWLALVLILMSVGNWVGSVGYAMPLDHTWSLAIEEQFYIAWPLLVARGASTRALGWLCGSMIVVAAVVRWLVDPWFAYSATVTRADGIAVGCLLALWVRSGRRVPHGAGTVAALVLLPLLVFMDNNLDPWDGRLVLPAVQLLAAVLIAAAVQQPRAAVTRALSWRPLVGLGVISYGVYLWLPLLQLPADADGYGHAQPGWVSLLMVPAVVAVGWLSRRFIERPALARVRGGKKAPRSPAEPARAA